jgi:hypothetical protein
MDKEIEEMRVELNMMTMKMQHEAHVSWRYEWTMRKKAKWPV